MEFELFNLNALDKNLKATVQRSGKIGFTDAAAKKMKLTTDKSISIGHPTGDQNGDVLFMILHDTPDEPNSFKVNGAGQYFYLSTKPLFDTLKLDYKSENITYDMFLEETTYQNKPVYKLVKRDKTKK